MAKETHLPEQNLPVAEIAYRILAERGTKMEWSELLDAILAIKKPTDAQTDLVKLRAGMYTEINLDNRFTYFGDGFWGLREWAPKGVPTRSVPLAASLRGRREKTRPDDEAYGIDNDDEEGGARLDDIDQLRRGDDGDDEDWDEPEGV